MKKKILVGIGVLLLVLLGGGYFVYTLNLPKVSLKIDTVSLSEEVNLKDVVQIEKGTLLENYLIDTQTLGNIEVEVVVQDVFKMKHSYSFEMIVVDVEKPVITYEEELQTTEGTEIDLLENVEATDNSQEEIIVSVEGDYDFDEPGEYTIYYVAKDSSGNEAKEMATLIVKEKEVVKNTNSSSSSSNTSSTSSTTSTITFTTSNGFQGVTKDGVTYIDGVLVVNKTYSLPSSYGNGLTSETMSAFNQMKEAAASEGLNIYISSGFRSYATQNTLYNNYVARDGKAEADTYSARAGHSEHQTGLAFDVNTISSAFNNTAEAKWLSANCYKYGFILRYPDGKQSITGYMYESWHFRYVGVELATKLYNDGDWITLEEYFGITSQYAE